MALRLLPSAYPASVYFQTCTSASPCTIRSSDFCSPRCTFISGGIWFLENSRECSLYLRFSLCSAWVRFLVWVPAHESHQSVAHHSGGFPANHSIDSHCSK